MGFENIERMFAPRSVAVVGASEKPASIGATIINNLLEEGFRGHVFPVNSNYENIAGYPAFKSVRDIPCKADLVIVATPIATVANIVEDCADRGFGGAVIISAGGRETGKTGVAVEAEILETIRGSDFRIIGPNCLGITSSRVSLSAGICRRLPLPGKMAFISQSGAICTAILDFAAKEHIGFSHFVSLGSMLDVDFADMIDYLGCDSKVGSILLYCENLSRIRNFMSAARAVSRVKPIIALKAGRTIAGASAAAVRTGVSTGEDAVYDAAFKRAGIIRVKTFAELFDCAEFIGKQRPPGGHGLAILTNAGGPGVMAADALGDYGMAPVGLSRKTLKKLDNVLPLNWSRSNPVDILGDASADRFSAAAEILIEAPEVNGLLIMLAPRNMSMPTRVAQALAVRLAGRAFPIFTAWLGGLDVEEGRAVFNRAGIPSFDSPERAVRAFVDLYHYSRGIEMLQEIPSKLPGEQYFDTKAARSIIGAGISRKNGQLFEKETEQLLAAYGIFVDPVKTVKNYKLAVGVKRDKEFGPVLFFGLGGEFTEVYKDRSLALPPLNRVLARRMMEETRIYQVLAGKSGFDPACTVELEALLIRLSQLVTDFAEINEIGINTLVIHENRTVAVKARAAVSYPPVKAPLHLCISAYPNQYEEEIHIEGAGSFLIRPIRPEDADLLEDLFNALSSASVHQRFFQSLKRLPRHMLSSFTQVDYDRQIALVALREDGERGKMIGVSRVIIQHGQKSAEFAITVSDSWHGKGIGAALLKKCLDIARQRNIEKIWAVVLPENVKMIALGRKQGFAVRRCQESSEYLLTLDLKENVREPEHFCAAG
ncbi:MAG: GNAT family N-acetyltransferase [Desulfobacteraceae bacterium]|nr:GNAT family N-acetyltransferase [Desulfobacteraceae bacterium]